MNKSNLYKMRFEEYVSWLFSFWAIPKNDERYIVKILACTQDKYTGEPMIHYQIVNTRISDIIPYTEFKNSPLIQGVDPGVLLDIGFISGVDYERFLRNKEKLSLPQRVVRGIKRYFLQY